MNNYCIDCGKGITRQAKRCRSCSKKTDKAKASVRIAQLASAKRTFEERSKSNKKAWINPTAKQLAHLKEMHGTPRTQKQMKNLEKAIEAQRRRTFKERSEISKEMWKHPSKKQLQHTKEIVALNPHFQSSWEDAFLNKYLKKIYPNLKIERQYYIKGFHHAFDFAIPELHLLFEVNGDYYHNLPGAKERDRKVDSFVLEIDWELFRFNDRKLKELNII